MVFCNIDGELITIIQKYAKNRTIIDVGCGDGLLGSFLPKVVSIDFIKYYTQLINKIIIMNIKDFPFVSNYFPVLLRPSHGMLVPDTLAAALQGKVTNCLLVSHPKNINDIPVDYAYQQIENNWTGNNGEKVYLITLNENINKKELKKFVRITHNSYPVDKKNINSLWVMEDTKEDH